MRTHLVGAGSATVLLIVVASCRLPDSDEASCADDVELCPSSSRAATSVTCDCKCTLGVSEDEGSTFEGRVDACLPSVLNEKIASNPERTALRALGTREFDQRVFRYCSEDVARFLRTTIRSRARGMAACAVPVHCDCTTEGAKRDSGVCHASCPEVACDPNNCPAVLWAGARLDASACTCSRATACGAVAPYEEDKGFCRDWLTTSFAKRAR